MNRNPLASGWRLPALAIVVALVALVGVARVGMREPAPPHSTLTLQPTPTAASVELPATPTNAPRPIASGGSVVVTTPSSIGFAYSPWPDRYADGIPREIGGKQVLRLNAATDLARLSATTISDTVLVGGWFSGASDSVDGCSPQGYEPWCSDGRLADDAAALGRGEGAEAAMPVVGVGAGPLVVSGTVQAHCSIHNVWSTPQDCTYSVAAKDIMWAGDDYTAAAPIAVEPLFSTLGAVMWFDPQPFHERPGCRLPRPAQTYTTGYGDVQMVFVFPSTDQRVAMATAVLNGPPYGDPTSGCATLPPLDGRSGWISRDNVLLRVIDYSGESGTTVRRLLDEMSATASQ